MNLDQMTSLLEDIKSLYETCSGVNFHPGDGQFNFKQLINAYLYTRDNLLPLKIGDRVEMVESLDVTKRPGYQAYATLIVVGATAVVHDLEFFRDGWRALIKLDKDPSHLFTFPMDCLRKLPPTPIAPNWIDWMESNG